MLSKSAARTMDSYWRWWVVHLWVEGVWELIMGALLAAGYAAAVSAQIASSPDKSQITTTVQQELTKSFASASSVANQVSPENASKIIAGAKAGFIDGADWAYTAGIIAILLGAVLVFFLFPKKDGEQALLAQYQEEDTAAHAAPVGASPSAQTGTVEDSTTAPP